jgi:hypothetical protein
MGRECADCQSPIADAKPSSAKYCSVVCQQRAHGRRKHKRERAIAPVSVAEVVRVQLVREMVAQSSVTKVARVLGWDIEDVRRIANVRTGRPRALTPEQVEEARALRAAGLSIREASAKMGVPRSTLADSLYRLTDNNHPPVRK